MSKFNPLDYPISFAAPLRIAPSAWALHVPFGMFIIDLLRPAIVVELGTHNGVSYSAFCQAVRELRLNTRAYAIDTWKGDEHAGFYGDEILVDLRKHHDPLYGEFSSLIQGTFDDAVKYFADASIDLLHIDGLHTYDAVKHDFETWVPKLSRHGVVMFHDINVRERDFGVWRLWDELSAKYPSFSINHGHGLGILAVGEEYPQTLNTLLEMQENEVKKFHELFYRLGKPLEIEQKVLDNIAWITNRDQVINELTAQVGKKDHLIDEFTAQVAEFEKIIGEYTTQIAKKEQKLHEYIAWIANRDQVVHELTAQVEEVKSSTAWRIVQLLWRVRVFIAPHGSTRERIGRLVMRGVHVWKTEGFTALLHKTYSKQKPSGTPARNISDAEGMPTSSNPYSQINESDASLYPKAYFSILQTAQNIVGHDYVPLSNEQFNFQNSPVKLIAFYLPQFHPIPENDQWWGKGFTEWSNVSKAAPQFMGHYQPHLPGELGFYDLRVPDVQRRQVELAKQYGLSGFCFYFYWFHGKRLLERPVDQFISDPEIDFPFCLCWANENWTRRWDGLESDILIAQEHSAENDQAFIQDIEPYLKHKNYIRVDDKPLLIVYRTELMPDPADTAERWRKYCKESGIGDIYLVASQAFGPLDPRRIGFDAAIEFPPNNMGINDITGSMTILNPEYSGRVYRYANAVEHMLRIPSPSYKLFKTVYPSWDNEPRKPGRGFSFAFSSPSLYKHWLIGASRFALEDPHPDKRLVFINAWNEWGEGAHLEPDRKYGYAYLQATADALRSLSGVNPAEPILAETVKRHETAVILHLYYPELWDEICLYLQNLEDDFDLYISSPSDVDLDTKKILQQHPNAYIYRCINRGRDIAPFLDIFKAIYALDYKYICKIHSKKSIHRVDGAVWRNDIYTKLLGSKEIICKIKKMFDNNETVGLVAPASHVVPSSTYWGSNEAKVKQLAKLANISVGEKFSFVGGSMFWFKPAAFYPLIALPLSVESFDVEAGQVDGTLAHAIERFFGLLIEKTWFIMFEADGETVKEVKDNSNFPFAQRG